MSMIDVALDKLTDNYQKAKSSKVGKLFQLVFSQFECVKGTFNQIEEWQDVDMAEGIPLENLARRVGEDRGQQQDELFRDFIKIRIRLNRSAGEMETLNEVGRLVFGDGFDGIEEAWYRPELDYEPAALLVSLNQSLTNFEGKTLKRVKGGGVKIYYQLNLEGDKLIATTKQYTFPVNYPVTGTFHTAPINGVASRATADVASNTYQFPVNYPVTGTFTCSAEISVNPHDVNGGEFGGPYYLPAIDGGYFADPYDQPGISGGIFESED